MNIICSLSAFKENHEDALTMIRALGFTEIDLILIENWGIVTPSQLVEDFDGQLKRVQNLLKKHDLKAVSINAAFSPQLYDRENPQVNQQRLDSVRATCRFMREMGIKIGAHYPGHIGDWKNDPEGVWKDTVTTLKEIQAIAKEEGVTFAPELHFKTPFEQPADARRLLAEIPGLPYTYEPSHFQVLEIPPTDTTDLLDGARHCHLRTAAPGVLQCQPDSDSLKILDWMIDLLRARNYQGYVSIEFLPGAEFDLKEAIRTLKDRYS
jgi:sugar phosphate isomerase/epimerase